MKVAPDGIRSVVRIGYDGRVHKRFRGKDREKRYANEARVLQMLEARGCDFVPRLLDRDDETLTLITTNCGVPAGKIVGKERADGLFKRIEDEYGVVHADPFPGNVTYLDRTGRFYAIDFEGAEIKENPDGSAGADESRRTLKWFGVSREGTRKAGNQDALSVYSFTKGWAEDESLAGKKPIDESGLVFVISDGMGGPAGGEVASELIVRNLRRFLPAKAGDFQGISDPYKLLGAAVESLHEHVSRVGERRDDIRGMGATVVVGLFYRTNVYFAHVGDSRLYRWRNGVLEQLTFDHTFAGRDFHENNIDERAFRMHPRRHLLYQVIGGGCGIPEPQIGSSFLKRGDWFLVCSDGVVDGLWNKDIADCFERGAAGDREPREVGHGMVEEAIAEAGGDDTTLFVVKVT